MSIPNHPVLADLASMPVGSVAALSPEILALLQDEADEALRSAKAIKDRLDGAIVLRYADRAQAARREENKDAGTVRFDDGSVTVVADLPKRVDWDQAQLAAVVERIRAAGDDPAEYVDITFKVPERKYTAWPENIRSAFDAARTVKTGKPTFKLMLGSGEGV